MGNRTETLLASVAEDRLEASLNLQGDERHEAFKDYYELDDANQKMVRDLISNLKKKD